MFSIKRMIKKWSQTFFKKTRFTYETRQLSVSLIERINFQDEIYTPVYTSSFSAVTFNPR